MNMPPGGFPPFNGNMARPTMQMGGMLRSPQNVMGGMGGRSPFNMFSGGMNQNPMQAMGRMSRIGARMPMGASGGMNGGGGILSRLFQRAGGAGGASGSAGNMANAAAGFQRAAGGGGGLLRGLTNPGAIGSFLNNTQNVLRTAQQIGPMVQQYGPLIRNVPGMIKMYRSLKSNDSDSDSETNEESNNNGTESSVKEDKKTSSSNKRKVSTRKAEGQKEDTDKRTSSPVSEKGSSVPKLYI